MSYIKNCKICGQRISLREMSHGQWVAFDVNTDKPHKHGKSSRKKASLKRQSNHTERETPTNNDGFPTGQTVVIVVVITGLLFFFLS